ncbi:hypothetical protein AZZ71_005515, partial [Klebsiella pneumoniae]
LVHVAVDVFPLEHTEAPYTCLLYTSRCV